MANHLLPWHAPSRGPTGSLCRAWECEEANSGQRPIALTHHTCHRGERWPTATVSYQHTQQEEHFHPHVFPQALPAGLLCAGGKGTRQGLALRCSWPQDTGLGTSPGSGWLCCSGKCGFARGIHTCPTTWSLCFRREDWVVPMKPAAPRLYPMRPDSIPKHFQWQCQKTEPTI